MKTFTTNAKKFTAVSLVLLMMPLLFFVSAFLRQLPNISISPDTWLEKVSFNWLRIAMFAAIFILLPLIALVLNVLSLNKFRNNERQAGMNMSKGIRLTNFIAIVVEG